MKSVEPQAPETDGAHDPQEGASPVGQALANAMLKAATPVDPYLALGVETARRMQVENALQAALGGLRAAAARIAELEAERAEHAPK